jgi:hypothetical protein
MKFCGQEEGAVDDFGCFRSRIDEWIHSHCLVDGQNVAMPKSQDLQS